MAGIGFRLHKLLSGESYSDLIRAYFYSSVIMAGPMLVIIISLGIIHPFASKHLNLEDAAFFMGLVVYIFAFSMLGVAPFLYGVTRYLADQYYLRRFEKFSATYLSVLEIVFVLQTLIAFFFLYFLPLSFSFKVLVTGLYLFVSGIWIAMIFLSAAKSYRWIVSGFVAGAFVGIFGSFVLGPRLGLFGFLLGFTAGEATAFFILTLRIFKEFGFEGKWNYQFFSYFRKYPFLIWIGIFYYLGIWVDKFIFWFSSEGQKILGGIRTFPNYDTPMFLAFLTVVPSMAFFLIQMETSFAKHYKAYYDAIRLRESLAVLKEKKQKIVDTISLYFQRFILFQGILSGLVILFIYQIGEVFHLNPSQLGILRIGILGAFIQMGFLILLNFFFYFDFQAEAFWMVFIFCTTNALFTIFSLNMGLPAYGFGFSVSCLLTLLFGFIVLDQKLKSLEYWTFMSQPILVPKFKFETEWQKLKAL